MVVTDRFYCIIEQRGPIPTAECQRNGFRCPSKNLAPCPSNYHDNWVVIRVGIIKKHATIYIFIGYREWFQECYRDQTYMICFWKRDTIRNWKGSLSTLHYDSMRVCAPKSRGAFPERSHYTRKPGSLKNIIGVHFNLNISFNKRKKNIPQFYRFNPQWGIGNDIPCNGEYRQICNISRTLVGHKIVHRSDVVGAAPVGAAPTTSSF